MILKQNYLIIFLVPLFAFTTHKYYISNTKIEYKKESKSIQITMQIFIDDLQDVLNETYHQNFELDTLEDSKRIDSLLDVYIHKKFFIKINALKKESIYLGKEVDDDITYLYLEIENIESINSLMITNNMLMEVFPSQKNIIRLKVNNIKKTFFLTSKKDNDLAQF